MAPQIPTPKQTPSKRLHSVSALVTFYATWERSHTSKLGVDFRSYRIAAVAALILSGASVVQAQDVPAFKVRPGFTVTLAAKDFGQARMLELAPNGVLFVSQNGPGTISTLKKQADGTYKKIAEFTTNKPSVSGMQWVDGWLWFTQSGTIWKARDTNGDGKADEEVKVLDGLPSGGGHWWRPILVTDKGFYTGIGDDGNTNDHLNDDREKIFFYSLDGQNKTLWSGGIRNTEKLRLRPGTSEVWGADHGSDNFGKELGENGPNQPVTDKVPPCEFNHYEEGKFYGHPFIIGTGVPRPEYRNRPDILDIAARTVLPAWALGAHWAPNGWCFAETDGLGAKGDAFIACHGSWNSSKRVGYRVERVVFDPVTGDPLGGQMMVSTLRDNGDVLGRPVDCTEESDGSILFSDDQTNKIFRISKAK